MSLITPLFLLGLIGIGLPIWLHRLQTQSNEREAFASSMFLEASKHRIHVQRKLKYWLLLAARILLLALLALAFTRPVWLLPPSAVLGDEDTHHVIIVDTSFSMQLSTAGPATAGQTQFDEALDRARAIIDNMGDNDQASLFSAGGSLVRIQEASADKTVLREALNSLEAGNGRLDLGQMMSSLNSLLEDSNASLQLHLISDFQQSGQPVRFADLVPDSISGNAVQLDLQRVVTTPQANWAITAVSASLGGVDVTVQGFNTPARERTLELSVNGTVYASQTQDVTANGQASYHFEGFELEAGDNRITARLQEDDQQAGDNLRYGVLDNSPPAPVLVLTHDADSLAHTYLQAALSTAPRPYTAEVITFNNLDPRILQRYPWIIIEDLGAVNTSLAEAIQNYVSGGGAVLAALGDLSRQLTTLPITAHQMQSGTVSPDERRLITNLDSSHPALQATSGWSGVNISQARPLQTTAEDTVLISLNRNIPLLLERSIGLGKFMLLNSSLDNTWSDLPLKPVFVGFLAETARYLSGEDILQRTQVVDSYLQLQASGGNSGQVYDPEGNQLLSLEDTTEEHNIALSQTGFYQVFTPGGEVLLAVNPDERESDTRLMAAQTLQNWQQAVANSAASRSNRSVDSSANANTNGTEVEIWRVILILLVMIVLAESLLGNRHLRYNTLHNNAGSTGSSP